jgi:ATP-dependent protease Clp ATPase subunit
MYEVPNLDDVTEVVVNADTVNKDDVQPIYVRGDSNKKSKKKKSEEKEKAAS